MSDTEGRGLDRPVDTSRQIDFMDASITSLTLRRLGRPLLALARLLTRNNACQWLLGASSKSGLLPWPILGRLRVVGTHTITSPSGHPITYVASADDALAPSLIWKRGWESTTLRVFSHLCKESSRIIDVGAYSGIYSLVAALENPELEVVAVEPNPEGYALLERNVAANGLGARIQSVQAAATSRGGSGTLYVNHDPTQSSMRPDPRATPHVGAVQVALVTLDELSCGNSVGVIKIDVEGVEFEVLEGGKVLIERDRPSLIVELLGEAEFEVVSAFLREFRYGSPLHLGPEGPQPSEEWKQCQNHWNYLFVHPDSPHSTIGFSVSPPV